LEGRECSDCNVRRLALAGAGGALAFVALSGVCTCRVIDRPAEPFAEPVPAGAAGLRLSTRDGETLGAWYGPAPGPVAVVLLHGNGSSRSRERDLFAALQARGHPVLAVSLRAHGDSTGERNTYGWDSRLDAVAAVDALERLIRDRRPQPRIVVVAVSIGAAAAVFAAPEVGDRVSGYLLQSPFQDFATASRNRLELYLPPVVDRLAYAGFRLWFPILAGVPPEGISPRAGAGSIPPRIPVWILTGTEDVLARPAEAEAIAARVRGPRRVVRFEGAGHVSLHQHDPRRFLGALDALIGAAGDQRGPSPPGPTPLTRK
jgi:pimeloyl-ACP methyl ester carboxylesterase